MHTASLSLVHAHVLNTNTSHEHEGLQDLGEAEQMPCRAAADGSPQLFVGACICVVCDLPPALALLVRAVRGD